MISRKTYRPSLRDGLCKSTQAVAFMATVLVCSPTSLQAAQTSHISSRAAAETSELHRNGQGTSVHIIQFNNAEGTEKIEFRENLRQRQCVASIEPDFLSLAPGETAEVRVDIRDSESSGCAGEPKYALWRAVVVGPGSRPLNYQILFTEDPREDTHGGRQIRSTLSSKPGAPYAATCGDRSCFDEWVPTSQTGSAIFFYRKR